MWRTFIYILVGIFICTAAVTGSLIANFAIVHPILIGDGCDSEELHFFVDIFYETSSNTGYHPEPNGINFALTVMVGLAIGAYTSRAVFNWWQNE